MRDVAMGLSSQPFAALLLRHLELFAMRVGQRFASRFERGLATRGQLTLHLFDQHRQRGLRVRCHSQIDLGRESL